MNLIGIDFKLLKKNWNGIWFCLITEKEQRKWKWKWKKTTNWKIERKIKEIQNANEWAAAFMF